MLRQSWKRSNMKVKWGSSDFLAGLEGRVPTPPLQGSLKIEDAVELKNTQSKLLV